MARHRAQEIAALGMGALDVSGTPPRRLAELSRYGGGKASLPRRHPDARRLATPRRGSAALARAQAAVVRPAARA